MSILLVSTGGGGGNILRSLKALFARDVAIAQKADAEYAGQLRRAITTRFLDTNEFSLAQVPEEERLLIGAATAGGLGSGHSPDVAERALEESRDQIERLIEKYSVVVTIGTGGKGTGAGTMFPLAEIVRRQHKLVVPVFVRPSFERHEVDKRRYDHAIDVAARFDAARIRLIEILNDRAYSDRDPQPQSVVWERMNLPIARGLRGLLYVLWDLSQVDPSDLSVLLAGNGRMRIGFGEINPADGSDPADAQIEEAVNRCWHNPYCAFSKPTGTSLVCIQGDWSNLADAKIKSGIASLALASVPADRYNPLYARAFQTPRPWGVTALFTEYTGVHEPVRLEWIRDTSSARIVDREIVVVTRVDAEPPASPAAPVAARAEPPPIATLWEFARALNRLDPAAIELAAREPLSEISIGGLDVKKLLGTVWFRSVFPRLSASWRERILESLAGTVVIPNHTFWRGRQAVRLAGSSYAELKEIAARTIVSGPAGTDLQLVLIVARLWGEQALGRLRFVEPAEPESASQVGAHRALPLLRQSDR